MSEHNGTQLDKGKLPAYRATADTYDDILEATSLDLIDEYLVPSGRLGLKREHELFLALDTMMASPAGVSKALAYDFEVRMLRYEHTTDAVLNEYDIDQDRARLTIERAAEDDEFWVSEDDPLDRLEYVYGENHELYYLLTRALVQRHVAVAEADRPAHAALIQHEFINRMHEDIDFWLSQEGIDTLNDIAPVNHVLHRELFTHLYEYAHRIDMERTRMAPIEATMEAILGSVQLDFETYYAEFEEVLYRDYVDTGRIDELIELLARYRQRGEGSNLGRLCDEFETRLLGNDRGYRVVRRLLDRSQDTPPQEDQDDNDNDSGEWKNPFDRKPKVKVKKPSKKEVYAREQQQFSADLARERFDMMMALIVQDQEIFDLQRGRLVQLERLDIDVHSELMRIATARLADRQVPYTDVAYLQAGVERYAASVNLIGRDYEYWGGPEGMDTLSDLYFRNRDLYRLMLRNLSTACRRTPSPKYEYAQFFEAQLAIYDAFEIDTDEPMVIEGLRRPSLGECIAGKIVWILNPEPERILHDGVVNPEWVTWYIDRAVYLEKRTSITRRLAALPVHDAVRRDDMWRYEEAAYHDLGEEHHILTEREMIRHLASYGPLYYHKLSEVLSDRIPAQALMVSSTEAANKAVVGALIGILEFSHSERAHENAFASFGAAENIMGLSAAQSRRLQEVSKILNRIPSWGFRRTGEEEARYSHNFLAFFRVWETRGLGVSVRITPKGLVVHNPAHTLGKLEKKEVELEYDNGRKVTVTERENAGGDDYLTVKWADIAAANVVIDFSRLTDFAMGIVSKVMMATDGKVGEPTMEGILERGPGSIQFSMPNRDTELLELPPMKYPRVLADLLQELAKIMTESPRDGMALLAYLSGAETKKK